LSFSDIDRGGWALVFSYIVVVLIYIQFRAPYNKLAVAAKQIESPKTSVQPHL
jgi:hypothetical protein